MKTLVILTRFVPLVVVFLLTSCDGRVGGPLSPPFGAKYREAWFGKGIVVTLTNQSDKVLYDVTMKIDRASRGTITVNVADSLSPNDTKDIGWMELSGGTLEVGDTIYVYAKGYAAPYVTSCSGPAP